MSELVSVLMCVYNTKSIYLREAIDSILNQTYSNIEFVIIDDYSTCEETLEVLSAIKDERVKIYHNNSNLGLTKSLNKGLMRCTGSYIARMDADDIALKDRIEKQINYIQRTNFLVIGSDFNLLPYRKKRVYITENYDKQKIRMIFGNHGIVHSTAFFDRKLLALDLIYDESYIRSQDYSLWCKVLEKGYGIGFCPDKLLLWRESHEQITRKYSSEQAKDANAIRKNYIFNNFEGDKELLTSFVKYISNKTYTISEINIKEIDNLVIDFMNVNSINNKLLEKEICRFWFMQSILRLKVFHKIDFLKSSLWYRIIKPSNLGYILKSFMTEKK